MEKIISFFKEGMNVSITILVIAIIFILFSPISPQLLDSLLLLNLSLALFVLLLTFYVKKPVEFSTFPSVLLIATLFRLSLNLSATRLILSDADAGQVIDAIGSHVVSGNYVIGVIVFLILVVVQYVVVTNGAQRVAEVAARFTLDSMPGQQMSIDADLNMGFIDQEQAQKRRKMLEKEAGFYGAMDGASKFVKGDAIAGIIIMLIDIIGGIAVGVAQHGMSWHEALQKYTLLTVGDGIVTQVPALVIAIGTGIIITRSASDNQLSHEIFKQFTSYPNILFMLAGIMSLLACLPGFPSIQAISLSAFFVLMGYLIRQFLSKREDDNDKSHESKNENRGDDTIYESMHIDTISLEISFSLSSLVGEKGEYLQDRIDIFRKQFALSKGLVLPRVIIKITKSLVDGEYRILFQGNKKGDGKLLDNHHWLAIHPGGEREELDGIETEDPAYHLPAIWIDESLRQEAREKGYTVVDTLTVFMTHFSELVKKNADILLTREEVEKLIGFVRNEQEGLVAELIPNILSIVDVQKVLQALLKEAVSVRNIQVILELLADVGRHSKEIEALTSFVRQHLSNTICDPLVDKEGSLHVMTLDTQVEQTLFEGLRLQEGKNTSLSLDPRFTEQLLKKVLLESQKMINANFIPVMICMPEVRSSLRKLTERMVPYLHVVALNEIPSNVNLSAFSAISF